MARDIGVAKDTGMGRDPIEAAESFPASNEPKSLHIFFGHTNHLYFSTYLIGCQLPFNK